MTAATQQPALTVAASGPIAAMRPSAWPTLRLKTIADVRLSGVDKRSAEDEQPVRLCNYVDVYRNERITAAIDFMLGTASRAEVARFGLRAGDVLITKDSESPLDIAVPAVVVDQLDTVLCGYHLALLRPHPEQLDGRFLAYALRARPVVAQFEAAAQGITRFAIGYDEIGSAHVPVPPLPEQRAIVAHLDGECARIDAMLAEQDRVIAGLEEERTVAAERLLAQPVPGTAAAMPPGGRIVRLKHVVPAIEQGWSPQCENRLAREEEWGVLKAGAVNGGVFRADEHKALPADLAPVEEYEVRSGDVLMSRASGSRDLVGATAYVERCRPRLLLCDKLFRLRYDPARVDPRLLAAALGTRALRAQIELEISGAEGLARSIAQGAIRELHLNIPPRPEQARIVEQLLAMGDQAAGAIEQARLVGQLLSEYRAALITDAVTGQLALTPEPA